MNYNGEIDALDYRRKAVFCCCVILVIGVLPQRQQLALTLMGVFVMRFAFSEVRYKSIWCEQLHV